MEGPAVDKEIHQLVTFRLGDEEYGIDILKVHEIDRMMDITEVPNAPSCVEGVINLRGKVVPVINLRRKFGLPPRERDGSTKIVVVDVGTSAGMIVDSVSEVLRIPSDIVEPPPRMATGVGSECIRGVGKLKDRLLILLDIEKVLDGDDSKAMADAAAGTY
jgi:purine-binding chemotaxis protein CheW